MALNGDLSPGYGFVIVTLLLLLNGFFVAAEFAVVKVRASRLDALACEGRRRAKFARSIVDRLDAYLSACRLGITLASLGLGWVGGPAIASMLRPLFAHLAFSEAMAHTVSFILAFSLIALFHILLGQHIPKTLAVCKSEQMTLWAAAPLVFFYRLTYPFLWMLNGASNALLRLTGASAETGRQSAHTEEEIRIFMKESHENGLIDPTELALFDNIFEFTETSAREIMIPRTEMECLYANRSYKENKQIALRSMRTRYPVCDPDKDNVIGFVHIKDLLKTDREPSDIRSILRPITTVPETMPISTLLKLMQRRRTQMALLIDEYGGTSGLVTLEDIMEEIVGEIQDEFDAEQRPRIEKKDEHSYSIDGRLLIEEVNGFFGLDIESGDYDTIGGWMYSQIEIPPVKNQKVRYRELAEFTIEETDHMRIVRLTVRKIRPETAGMPERAEAR
jgi:CBS domain containing-hemolysin-like protein